MLEKSSTCFVWSFKLNLFCLFCFTIPTQLVLFCLKSQLFLFDFGAIDYEMDGSVFEKNDLLRCLNLSLVNWIGGLTLSLLLKAFSKKLEPWFAQWSFFLRLLLISINLPFSFAWNTDVMCGLVLLTSTYIYQISNWNRCVVMLVFHLLPLLNPWLIVEISLSLFYSCSSELVELVQLPQSCSSPIPHFNRFHDFSVTITSCYKDVPYQQFLSLHS